jgi:hypothetical protein
MLIWRGYASISGMTSTPYGIGWSLACFTSGGKQLNRPSLRASNDHHPSKCSLQARLFFLFRKGIHVGLGAAVERGPSQSARSASTKGTWPHFPISQNFLVISPGMGPD